MEADTESVKGVSKTKVGCSLVPLHRVKCMTSQHFVPYLTLTYLNRIKFKQCEDVVNI